VEQPQSSAPASAYAEIDIAATERDVWTVLADIASWPTWNPAVRHAVCDETLEVGSRFRFSTEIGTLSCKVTAVDAPRRLSWKGRVLLIGERQTWLFEPSPTGTHVSVHAEMIGIGSRLFRRRLAERLPGVLDALLQLLRLEAEVRFSEGEAGVAGTAEAKGRARAHE
jgi:uncharacterized protein YndB with AHSA1/START domain